MNSQWSENLRKKMEVHEEPSPEGLWENINDIVTKEFPVQTNLQPIRPLKRLFHSNRNADQSSKGERNFVLWTKWVGAAACLLLLLFLGDLFLQKENPHITTTSQLPEVAHKANSENNILLKKEENLFTQNKGSISVTSKRKKINHTTTTAPLSENDKAITSIIHEEIILRDNNDQIELHTENSDIDEKNHQRETESKEQPQDYDIPVIDDIHYPTITRRKKSATWETSLYASNIPSGSSKEYNGYRSFLAEEISDATSDISPLFVKQPHEGIVAANKKNSVSSIAKHRQPITLGASVKYNLNEKWSLTSGLTYTLLSSQLRSGSQNNYYTSEQSLHNIGIPLNVNYNLWKSGNFSIYLSAGGALEKNVSGTLRTDYFLNDQFDSNKKEKIRMDRLQWSFNGAVGIEYSLFHNIALYAAPGINYYFENGSTIETVYKENPVNMNLSAGFRFILGD